MLVFTTRGLEALMIMTGKHILIDKICAAFQQVQFSEENFLQGSFEGEEPHTDEKKYLEAILQ